MGRALVLSGLPRPRWSPRSGTGLSGEARSFLWPVPEEIGGAAVTVLRTCGQEPHDRAVQGLRNLQIRLARAARRTLRVLGGHVRRSGDGEGHATREHLVEDHAQRVQVAWRTD